MIKLNKPGPPTCLNPTITAPLIADFIKNGTVVWDIEELKQSLLEFSFNKCSYCECNIKEESKYMEVEHFICKQQDPSKVLEWDNLLPSCKRCNGSKGTHNVVIEPIINPCRINPKDHLAFRLYNFIAKTTIGDTTIDVIDLNNTERAVFKRYEIGQSIHEAITEATTRLLTFQTANSTRNRNRLTSIIRKVLLECQPDAIYAATTSTLLHSSNEYINLRSRMISLSIWSQELENLHNTSNNIALDYL